MEVLLIRKPDRTTHIVPADQLDFYKAQNNRLKANDKMGLEIMDLQEAEKVPFYDKDYKGASEANASLKEKDNRIAELEAKLAALQAGGGASAEETAVEKIARINEASSRDQVIEILGDDARKTVKDAAEKKIASFN